MSVGATNSVVKVIPALLVTMLAAMLFCALLNTATERVAYRPLRGAPRLAPLITAIGMSFIFQNVGLNRLGPAPVSVPNVLSHNSVFTIGGHEHRLYQPMVGPTTPPGLAPPVYLSQKTTQGKAMPAVAP